jgi:hypothetical protein
MILIEPLPVAESTFAMKRLILFVFTVWFATSAFAHRDRLGKISRAELTFQDGGTVILTKDRITVLSLALKTDSGQVEVKKEDLAGIDYPQFDTIVMTWGAFRSGDLAGVPYKCVSFSFGSADQKAFGEYPEVTFYFYGDKYHHRGVKKMISQDSWKTEDPMFGGGESVLNPSLKK